MLYKETPFLGYCIALACGIAAAALIHINGIIIPLLLVLSCLISITYYYTRKTIRSVLFGVFINIFIFIFGYSSLVIINNKQLKLEDESINLTAVLDDYPLQKPNSLMLSLKIISVNGKKLSGKNRMMIYTKKDTGLKEESPGTVITFTCLPIEITDFNLHDNFDYQKYMKRKGYIYYAFLNSKVNITGKRNSLRYSALKIRSKLLTIIHTSIDNSEIEAVVAALTLGYKNLLEPEIKENFQRSGIIHILAVSGLHVGIISYISLLAFSFFKGRLRIFQILVSLAIIWTYALLTGFSPSVLRASLMFSFLSIGSFLKRPVIPLNSVLASAFILLLINPYLLFDPSFLLSYSAVVYIVVFYQDLYTKLNFSSMILDYFWKIIVVSILAQLGTLPFVILFFNKVPILGLLSNLVAIPLVFILLISGIMLIITNGIAPFSKIISKIIIESGEFLVSVSQYVSSFKFAVINIEQISIFRLILLLICIFMMIMFILKKNKIHPHIVLISLILYTLSSLW